MNLDAEQTVLGAFLAEPARLLNSISSVKVEWFQEPKHKLLYQSMLKLVQGNKEITPALLREDLGSDGWEYIGGSAEISNLLASSTNDVQPYIEVLQKEYQRSVLQDASYKITKALKDNADPIDIIGKVQQLSLDLLPKEQSTADMMQGWVSEIMGDKTPRITTGLPQTDGLLKMRDGQLIILAGRPREGKTTLALNIMLHNLQFHKKIAFFSLEMNRNDILSKLFATYSQVPLSKITAKHIIVVFAGLKKMGRSPDYVLSVFRAFRAAWMASRRIKIPVPDIMPDLSEMMPQPVKKRRTILQPAELKRLLLAARGNPITHAVLLCMMNTAMRVSECLGLRVSDVDFERLVVTVEQQVLRKPAPDGSRFGPHKTHKTHGPRLIRMTRMLAEELKKLRPVLAAMKLKAGEAWQDNDLWFPTSIGTPYSYSAWERKYWAPLFKVAQVPRIRVHDLRHSVATFLLAEGVPVPTVQEICGHADIDTTMQYKHLLVTAQDEAMRKLDQALNG